MILYTIKMINKVQVLYNVAKLEGISQSGYRIISNCGSHGRQEVKHLHIHVLGGAPMRYGLG